MAKFDLDLVESAPVIPDPDDVPPAGAGGSRLGFEAIRLCRGPEGFQNRVAGRARVLAQPAQAKGMTPCGVRASWLRELLSANLQTRVRRE